MFALAGTLFCGIIYPPNAFGIQLLQKQGSINLRSFKMVKLGVSDRRAKRGLFWHAVLYCMWIICYALTWFGKSHFKLEGVYFLSSFLSRFLSTLISGREEAVYDLQRDLGNLSLHRLVIPRVLSPSEVYELNQYPVSICSSMLYCYHH